MEISKILGWIVLFVGLAWITILTIRERKDNNEAKYIIVKEKLLIGPRQYVIYLETSEAGIILGVTRNSIALIDIVDHLTPISSEQKQQRKLNEGRSNLVVLPFRNENQNGTLNDSSVRTRAICERVMTKLKALQMFLKNEERNN